jgi:uncharacterized membrane protein
MEGVKDAEGKDQGLQDLREARILKFINQSIAQRGTGHRDDQVGLILFGRWPRLDLPPATVPRLNLTDRQIQRITGSLDPTYTDIGAAIKLALASFPEGTGKRIVLISDGNQNLGDALAQVRLAQHNGVEIDVVPLAATRDRQAEIMVERVEVPPLTGGGAQTLLSVFVRNLSARKVTGTLYVVRKGLKQQTANGVVAGEVQETNLVGSPGPNGQWRPGKLYTLEPGQNEILVPETTAKKDESYIYEARFVPRNLPNDRIENNQASASVVARGQRAVLFIEPKLGMHKLLIDRLRAANPQRLVLTLEPQQLPKQPGELAVLLSRFDSIIVGNVPEESLEVAQQKVLRSNTEDQGCGLVMIGGPNGFGAGGWKGSELEKALPVVCDLKSTKIEGKGGLVLIMHASEIAEGNQWQKKIARVAIEKLSPMDMVGMLYFDWQGGGHKWHIPFQEVKGNREAILRRLDSMAPGDMPDAEPSLRKSRDALSDPQHGLATKHVIFISDGDHWAPPVALLKDMAKRKISVTTVCITSHGQAEYARMAEVAKLTSWTHDGKKIGGRYYPHKKDGNGNYIPLDPRELPAIYTKEARLISKSWIYNKPFTPELKTIGGPTLGLQQNELKTLYGFVRTTKRNSPLVTAAIRTPKLGKEDPYPILAYWQYGLGKSVAFTSDALTTEKDAKHWDHDWAANSPVYTQFWEQVVEWSLRAVETGKNLKLTSRVENGKVYLRLYARDKDNEDAPLTNLKLDVKVTAATTKGQGKQPQVKFEQVGVGLYEAAFKAEDVGDYFLNIKARWQAKGKEKGQPAQWVEDGVRAGVTIPYSPEFAETSSHPDLLEKIAQETNGKVYPETAEALDEAARLGEVFRPQAVQNQNVSLQPIRNWLIVLAGLCLVGGIAVRRIAIEIGKLMTQAAVVWARLRGMRVPVAAAPQFLDRLKTRKSEIGEQLEKKAARRFEAGDQPVEAPPTASDAAAASQRPTAPRPPVDKPKLTPEQEQEAGDFASRLMRAKKKIWEERDKDKK